MQNIGKRIKDLRKQNDLTQEKLATLLGVTDKAVSRWERDECAPDLSVIPVLAEIFDITIDELLRGQRKQLQDSVTQYDVQKTEELFGGKWCEETIKLYGKNNADLIINEAVDNYYGIPKDDMSVIVCKFIKNS